MSWKAEYIILIIISTLIDYISGLQIYKSESQLTKKIFLGLSLCTNLGLLFTFKYFNFFSDSIRTLLQSISIQLDPITLKLLLPVGISFYTFQTLSYTIDVYRGKIKPEKHLGIFAVYVSFFPQLVAGPIERAKRLLPQFYKKHEFDYKSFKKGLIQMLWGFFKKMVIADRAAYFVNMVYNNPYNYSGVPLIVSTILFGIQIYCDFSGYSDIALGTAKLMGFKLMINFKKPYRSKSISEFWSRWHVSLSTWFKDYLYIPLGGNRVSNLRWNLNLFIVFLVSGLWHGANWTFVIWGALHGTYLIIENVFRTATKKFIKNVEIFNHNLIKGLKILYVYLAVNLGWIFFRANNVNDAIYIVKNLLINLNLEFIKQNLIPHLFLISFFSIFVIIEHIPKRNLDIKKIISKMPKIIRYSLYVSMIMLIILFGVFSKTQFIYFQF